MMLLIMQVLITLLMVMFTLAIGDIRGRRALREDLAEIGIKIPSDREIRRMLTTLPKERS